MGAGMSKILVGTRLCGRRNLLLPLIAIVKGAATTVDGKGSLSDNFLGIFPFFVPLLVTKLIAKWTRAPGQLSGSHWV